jgi:hypothetical protein
MSDQTCSKITVLPDTVPCTLGDVDRRFRDDYCLCHNHRPDDGISETSVYRSETNGAISQNALSSYSAPCEPESHRTFSYPLLQLGNPACSLEKYRSFSQSHTVSHLLCRYAYTHIHNHTYVTPCDKIAYRFTTRA